MTAIRILERSRENVLSCILARSPRGYMHCLRTRVLSEESVARTEERNVGTVVGSRKRKPLQGGYGKI